MMQQSLSFEQIKSLCRHTFDATISPEAIRPLSGGTFNTTYAIILPEYQPEHQVVLRIAPSSDADLSWDDHWLMRREYSIQPWFAAITPMMPRIIAVDFTHQLVNRDYMFQTHVEGERWEDIADAMAQVEQDQLWRQFGLVMRQIHDTTGDVFGSPHPETSFLTWSEAFLDRLNRISDELRQRGGDVELLAPIRALANDQRHILDQVQRPHLLHGDLWLFNLLVKRESEEATITGVLDADRAWWGDPLADWTMFSLSKSQSDETRRAHCMFWDAYGPHEQSAGAEIRTAFYDAMNAGSGYVWAIKQNDAHTCALARSELRAVAQRLSASLS